jgi:predicted nucleotidyltransferase
MRRPIGQRRAQLYLREYPRLLRQIRKLVALVREQDPNVTLLALFGSTARLEPHAYSDGDLLVLLHDPRVIYKIGETAKIIHLIGEAEEAPYEEWCDWTFSGMVGNAEGSDIEPEFLENIGAHGVLLYQQEGVALPPALKGLLPFDAWLERVKALLAECERVTASKTLPNNIPA